MFGPVAQPKPCESASFSVLAAWLQLSVPADLPEVTADN